MLAVADQQRSLIDHLFRINDPILLPDINFTQSQLVKALHQAHLLKDQLDRFTKISQKGSLVLSNQFDGVQSLLEKNRIAKTVIEKIGSLTFVKRRPEDAKSYLHYVDACLEKEEPLVFRVGFGPIKNVNLNVTDQNPDFAEYLTLIQLARVMLAIGSLYPYGVKVQLVPDSLRAQAANSYPPEHVKRYIDGLRRIVQGLSFDKWFCVEDGQQRLYDLYRVNDYWDAAEESMRAGNCAESFEFSDKWNKAYKNAKKNIHSVSNDNDDAAVKESAWRYLVGHRAEILSGLWSADDAFPLRYGCHPGFYQIYSLGYKKTKMAWQISLPLSLLPDHNVPGL